MAKQEYKATLSRSKGRTNWCVIFRHPLRMTSDGRPGLRVRKGLGTNDEHEAQRLVDQLNEILGNKSIWTPAAKDSAERKYDHRIISAFYKDLTPALRDSRVMRDNIIPLPGIGEDYIRILFLGTTGSGKTTIVRQLIGTDPEKERFPSISPAKTTVCDIEVITVNGLYKAVITFLPKEKARHYIEECVLNAVMEHVDNEPTTKVLKKFLEHTDQRFRLSYILGSPQILSISTTEDELADEDDNEAEGSHGEQLVTEDDRIKLSERLRDYITRIQSLAESSKEKLIDELNVSDEETTEDWEAFQELVEYQLFNDEKFHLLIDEILDDVESRFNYVEKGEMDLGDDGWPAFWKFESQDRQEFISTLNRFSSNYAPNFGRLLTPLVNGMRVSGPFKPVWWGDQDDPKLVLMDGEGLGHTSESVSSISTAVTKRYDETDVILLVDNAAQPMQASPFSVLRSLVSSGHESKLIICFTHFDELKGDNLPDTVSKKSHVLYSIDGAIAGISKILGRSAENALKKATSGRVFFLSNIQNKLSPKARLTMTEFREMLECIERVAHPEFADTATPIYDVANLVLCIQKALQEFHLPWRARLGLEFHPDVTKEHWARIKALSRRLGVLGEDQYFPLMPVADLIGRLIEHFSMFLAEPLKWNPPNPQEDSKREAIDRVEREVFSLLHKFASDRIFINRVNEWNHAYYAHRGPGSTIGRATDIRGIYDAAAPTPGEVPTSDANKFLSDIRKLVKDAIHTGGGEMVAS